MDAGVQGAEQALNGLHAHAGVALGEGVGTDEHHRAGRGLIDRPTDPNGVALEDVLLQALGVFGGNQAVHEVTKAGRDPVDDLACAQETLDRLPRPRHALAGRR